LHSLMKKARTLEEPALELPAAREVAEERRAVERDVARRNQKVASALRVVGGSHCGTLNSFAMHGSFIRFASSSGVSPFEVRERDGSNPAASNVATDCC
jgi:hypothetical protein